MSTHLIRTKMGFDFLIQLVLHICPETGKPFVYSGLKRDFSIPELNIPKEHRRFIQQRGSIFHAYTYTFNEENIYTVDIYRLLEEFPEWTTVKESAWYGGWEDDWTEEDHNDFKEALTWFKQQPFSYQASWSY